MDPASGDSIRAFIAVEVGEEVARHAAAVVERLRGEEEIKWVEARNFHLTLKFLGATRRAELPHLSAALRELATGAAPFELEFAGVGAFPSPRRAQVIWLGLVAGEDVLAGLAGAVEDAGAALGCAREARPFRAHLTLGRARRPERRAARGPAPVDLTRVLEAERDTAAGTTSVHRIVLMQSELRRDGPIYTIIDSFPLGGGKETHVG